jgi:hypothetical protein
MTPLREPPCAPSPCTQCGHPEDAHLFNAATQYPSEGWVTCPVQGCDCYGTWSLDAKSKAAMDQFRAEHERRIGEPGDEPPAV